MTASMFHVTGFRCDFPMAAVAMSAYESLKRALRADLDEEAWNSLYWTTSRSFPADETMKVLELHGSQPGSR